MAAIKFILYSLGIQLVASLLPDSVVNFNYCNFNQYCRAPNKHIGCTNPRTYIDPVNCPNSKNISYLDFDSKYITQVVDEHNRVRNVVASGELPGFPKAAKMPTLRWDDTLAYLAEANTRQCDMIHDKCRATDKYLYTGQNLCMTPPFSTPQNVSEIIQDCMDIWYSESEGLGAEIIDICCPNPRKPMKVGHFTQMMVDRADKMGCALMTFFKDNGYSYLFACDYSSTNVIGFPVYKRLGTSSECTLPNPKYPALCYDGEKIDPNFLLRKKVVLLQQQQFSNRK